MSMTTNTNGTTAHDYEHDADTLLEVWRAARERALKALEAKRARIAAQLAAVDAQIAEMGVKPAALLPKRHGRVGRPRVPGSAPDQLRTLLREQPGLDRPGIFAAMPNTSHHALSSALYRLEKLGHVRHEGDRGLRRYFLAEQA